MTSLIKEDKPNPKKREFSENENGYSYICEYEDNKRHGDGVVIFKNAKCTGNWNNGVLKKIKIEWSDNNYFEGSVKTLNQEIVYDGTRTYTNGAIYEGELVSGIRHGFGRFTYNKEVYCGYWSNGKRNGSGEQVYRNGDMYTGKWLDNKKHGKGKFIKGGEIVIGIWENDELVEN
jgi:hypothetical protein